MFKCSILMPAYNSLDSIDRCLESIYKQIFTNFDIVCINDGSTDGTEKIIKKWENIFGKNRFIYIENKKNIGITKSLNRGLGIIENEYIARIDADDWWHPEKLGKQIQFLENNKEYGVIGCNYINIINEKRNKINLLGKDSEIRKKIMKGNPFAHSCVLFRTKLVKNLGGYDEKIKHGQDYNLWLRCMPYTKFHNLQEFLCYRSADTSKSTVNKEEQMVQGIKTRLEYIKKYNYSRLNYLYLLEPLATMLFHRFFKKNRTNK